MNLLIFTVSTLFLVTLQVHLPTLGWLGGLRLELLPALVACAALTLRRGGALLLALCVGFAQDSFSAAPFGTTALLYGIGAVVLADTRETFDRELPWLQMGAGALLAAMTSVGACVVLGFSVGALFKILLVAAVSGIITPILFLAIDFLRLWGRAS
jgi:rod shape-determining protein MreD